MVVDTLLTPQSLGIMPDRANIELVIFDCDGVLVDSELLSARVLMSMMAETGLPITTEIFRADFLGRSFAAASERVMRRLGRPLPDDFQMRYRARLLEVMRNNLEPMAGVEEVLREPGLPFCLATSSSPERLATTLRVTRLEKYFEGKCFTASQVEKGKPQPDLFLFAAAAMKTDARKCLVIEDSEMGVRAALAAGMRCWHFTGGAHIKAGYRLPAEVVPERDIGSMTELKQALIVMQAGVF